MNFITSPSDYKTSSKIKNGISLNNLRVCVFRHLARSSFHNTENRNRILEYRTIKPQYCEQKLNQVVMSQFFTKITASLNPVTDSPIKLIFKSC